MSVKRIFSVVLSVLMIMASLVSVSAVSAAEIENVDISVYDVTVTVKVPVEIAGTMTAQILDADETQLFAIGSQNVKVDDTTYEISLVMPQYATTGDYIVKVGNNVSVATRGFEYNDVSSLVEFYSDFADKRDDGEELAAFLADCEGAPINLTAYRELGPDVQYPAALKIATVEGLAEITIDSDPAVIDANNAALEAIYEETMELAEALYDYSSYPLCGGTEELPLELTHGDIYDYYMAEIAKIDSADEFTEENFADLFDRGIIMYVLKEKDVDYLKDVFLIYEEAGSIEVDMTNINKLISKRADGELWKKLYAKPNQTIEDVIENAESIAATLLGGGGGGGGGADRGDTTDLPTNPTAPGAMIDKPATTVTFADLGSAEWAREAVEALAAKGVINGKETGKFAPNDNVTREEITKIITSAFGLVEKSAECDFQDVASDRWSYVYIASASRLGVVNGYGADFGPANKTTREDMAVMIYRVLKLLDIEVSGTAQNFTDSANISGYAKEAVNALTSAGIINGMGDGTFAPKAYVTRAQIAKVTYELLNLAGGNQ